MIFCQIQKYLDLIKIHSLVYKWFLHCNVSTHKSFTCWMEVTDSDAKVARSASEEQKDSNEIKPQREN